MSQKDRHRDDVPPLKKPAPTPLFSAAMPDVEDYPLIHLPEERFYAIVEHANRLASDSHGTAENFLTGLLGEFGYARPLGLTDEVNTEVIADGGDGGTDFTYRGATIDVKTVGQHRDDPALTVDPTGRWTRTTTHWPAASVRPRSG